MSRIAYVNGRYLPFRDAKVHVEDRGYQFARRRVRSLRGAGRAADRRAAPSGAARALARRIAHPHADVARRARLVLREVVARNRIGYGILYLQVTRGVARRDHAFPPPEVRAEPGRDRAPAQQRRATRRWPPRASPSSACRTTAGAASTSRPSGCCPTCWPGRRRSSRARATPGSSIATAHVTEGASANAWIVTAAGTVVTRPADHAILRGDHPHRAVRGDQGARACGRGAAFHTRGGLRGARSVRDLGDSDRGAGGAHRRPSRSATASPGPVATALRAEFHAMRSGA